MRRDTSLVMSEGTVRAGTYCAAPLPCCTNYSLGELLLVVGEEGRPTRDHLEDEHAVRPEVCGVVVALLEDDLRRHAEESALSSE